MFKPKYRTLLGNFPKFRSKNSKFSVLSENWHSWYLKDADSFSNISFPNVQTKNSFLSKFGPKKWKLSVLSESWHTWYLKDADSYSNINFVKFRPQNLVLGKFGPKKSDLSVLSERWHTWYLKEADCYSDISFLNFQPKIHFGQIWAKKVKVVRFLWILTHMISRWCWFLFQHLFSEFQTKNRFLAKFRPKKQICPFCLKIGTHGI